MLFRKVGDYLKNPSLKSPEKNTDVSMVSGINQHHPA